MYYKNYNNFTLQEITINYFMFYDCFLVRIILLVDIQYILGHLEVAF